MNETNSTLNKLPPKQELFCNLYATEREFFGNGTESYIEAYNIDLNRKGAYAGARASASKLLTKSNILKRIDSLLEASVLNDQFVDKQIAFLIAQNAEFSTKLGAIKEYNALKNRITKKLDLTTQGESLNPYSALTQDELRKLAGK